ncbi:hypothetical protein KKI96_21695, partial [Xenorhabdus bovienii]|nr:hypothetical protein [Xenorhabdus bovienii]
MNIVNPFFASPISTHKAHSSITENLGLAETKKQAENALPKNSTQSFKSGDHAISNGSDYCSLTLEKPDGRQVILSTTKHEKDFFLAFTYRDMNNTDTVIRVPHRAGIMALQSDIEPTIPIGGSFIWNNPLSQLPGYNDIFMANEGRAFDSREYPVAAKLFPNSKMPDDRGYAIRAADNGRKIDPGRTVGTYQDDAMRNITG